MWERHMIYFLLEDAFSWEIFIWFSIIIIISFTKYLSYFALLFRLYIPLNYQEQLRLDNMINNNYDRTIISAYKTKKQF